MLRHLFFILFFLSFLASNVHAALSPEYQQMKEEDAIRKSDELKGRTIRSMFMYDEDGNRYYEVKADCTYKFIVNYHVNLLSLLGWVGPKEFDVKMQGEPNCENPVPTQSNHTDLKTTIFEHISEIYEMPINTISSHMSLYHVPTDKDKIGMDFRIIALREILEVEANCYIKIDLFMTIRTVDDLLILANKYCFSSD